MRQDKYCRGQRLQPIFQGAGLYALNEIAELSPVAHHDESRPVGGMIVWAAQQRERRLSQRLGFCERGFLAVSLSQEILVEADHELSRGGRVDFPLIFLNPKLIIATYTESR